MSYVTGAHNFKVGLQVRTGESQELFETRQDIVQVVNNGVPQLRAPGEQPERPQGVRRQHRRSTCRTRGRSAASPSTRGLRYERFAMSIPQQSAGAGRWVPAREFAEQSNLVNWNTLSPRFGMSWDVFGDGRTAVKGGLSQLRSARGHHHHPAAQRQEHRLPDLPVDRHQRRPARAGQTRSRSRAAPDRCSQASASSIPT